MKIDEAYLIAKDYKENIDNGTEYENGFVFGCSDDDNFIGGAGHTPVVVMKEKGNVVDFPYFMTHGAGAEIRSFKISSDGEIREV